MHWIPDKKPFHSVVVLQGLATIRIRTSVWKTNFSSHLYMYTILKETPYGVKKEHIFSSTNEYPVGKQKKHQCDKKDTDWFRCEKQQLARGHKAT